MAVTSTITVGCNYDVKGYFDRIYAFASGYCSNLVRDMFQATYRVRHINDKMMVAIYRNGWMYWRYWKRVIVMGWMSWIEDFELRQRGGLYTYKWIYCRNWIQRNYLITHS